MNARALLDALLNPEVRAVWKGRRLSVEVYAEGKRRGVLEAALGTAKSFEKSYDAIPDEDIIQEKGTVGFVYSMRVAGGVRGQGLGRQMLMRAVQELKSKGAQAIYLQASDEDGQDPDPTGFYEKCGFQEVGRDSIGQPYMRLG